MSADNRRPVVLVQRLPSPFHSPTPFHPTSPSLTQSMITPPLTPSPPSLPSSVTGHLRSPPTLFAISPPSRSSSLAVLALIRSTSTSAAAVASSSPMPVLPSPRTSQIVLSPDDRRLQEDFPGEPLGEESFMAEKPRGRSVAVRVGGKRIGIVGLGNIGSLVAKRLEALGCHIAYTSRRKKPSVQFPYHATVHDLAAHSDALILCCALTEETRHVVNKEVMAVLGKNGVIINVGRGGLIDEEEMVRLLVDGELGGAGLDVFENEPHVPKELYEMDNVVFSPHCAVLTPESFELLKELIVSNLKAFFANETLQAVVQL